MFYALMGEPHKQATAPIKLRQGCRGVVYDAVKHLSQAQMVTVRYHEGQIAEVKSDGMQVFLTTVKESIQKETPVRESEEFDRVLYDDRARRQAGESMTAYCIRRDQEFKRLSTQIAGDCLIPLKMQAHLLLKFSGLSVSQRTGIISSCGNEVDLLKYQRALKMQYPRVHEFEHRERGKARGATSKEALAVGKRTRLFQKWSLHGRRSLGF